MCLTIYESFAKCTALITLHRKLIATKVFILKSSLDSLLDIDELIQPEYCDQSSSINYVENTFNCSVVSIQDNKALAFFSEGDHCIITCCHCVSWFTGRNTFRYADVEYNFE